MMVFLQRRWLRFKIFFFMILVSPMGYAASPDAPSLGDMSKNMYDVFSLFAGLLYNICYVIGAAFIAGSVIQYKAYRDNPSQVPLNRPVLLLFFGLLLIALPFITRLSSGAPT
jgi:intracellular multiplication protein IcmD